MSEWNPNESPDEAAGGTMVAVPRVAETPQNAGGTMVGIARPPLTPGGPFGFGALAMPAPQPVQPSQPQAGGTMVGIGRVQIPGASQGFAPPAQPAPESGGTMVGIGRVQIPGASQGFAPPSQPAPEAGGTMVGIGRVQIPGASQGFAPPSQAAPEAGGTMVGLGRVQIPGAPQGFAHQAPEAGGTMVGMARFGAMPMPEQQQAPESGGTMVGMARFGAMPMAEQQQAPEAGGTMVGMARFGAPAVPQRPSGPPPAYEILAHLGGGELGEVFHARHRDTGHEYALRIVRPAIADVPGAVDALRDVVSLAQNAAHTHLGQQLALDETASPALVLEFVPGKTLQQLMQERGAAPPAAVIDLGVKLCSALAAAHGAGLAHGRVHPGNVTLEAKTGRWVLLDLGHGYAVQGLEPAHDLYALGALLYQLATGMDPFATDPIQDPRVHKPKLPAGLSALLMRTLAPDPALWFPSAIDLAQALVRAKSMP